MKILTLNALAVILLTSGLVGCGWSPTDAQKLQAQADELNARAALTAAQANLARAGAVEPVPRVIEIDHRPSAHQQAPARQVPNTQPKGTTYERSTDTYVSPFYVGPPGLQGQTQRYDQGGAVKGFVTRECIAHCR